ncbi:MAG: hypothetical protein ABW128_01095, partial [Rhizorhabdus sp.]
MSKGSSADIVGGGVSMNFRRHAIRRAGLLGLAALGAVTTLAFAGEVAPSVSAALASSGLITLPAANKAATNVAPKPTPTPATSLATAVVGQRFQVAGFGSNPGNLTMYAYIPIGLPRDAPLVVVMHGCSSSAAAMDDEPGWVGMANAYKFALVFPETNTTNETNYGCFRSWD